MFDFNLFDIKLETSLLGRNFIYLVEIASTNTFILDKKNKIIKDGSLVLAEKQTKGKGRRNRVWYSEKGLNLNFSILITDKKLLSKNLNILNLGVSLVIANSIENLYSVQTNVKWPNDVLINNKKVAGILLETNSQGNSIEKLIIGIGVNVNQTSFMGEFNLEPTSIKLITKNNIEREKLLAEILNNLEYIFQKIRSNPNSVLTDWVNKCNSIGKRIDVNQDGKVLTGVFEGLEENGFLLLKVKDKLNKIYFGDINVE
ncbi:MAG: biotin--[acetyl-CoA-carboxylase] ligase [Ignavibacteriales bacterium CG12_big_fil_rev_8_21_14_0_65_30_8]|nr:MAG: biotin--[acetyl-CoA-carboxylase] ligase [Ignavibacteriales bacterium CG12_big_fil_rev_8_21_14_0_65_30_8]